MTRDSHSNMQAVIRPAFLPICAALAFLACEGCGDPTTPPPATLSGVTITVRGTVTSSVNGKPIAGAYVRLHEASVRTGADGRFEFTDVGAGSMILSCSAAGFAAFQTVITTSDRVSRDIRLTRLEVFEYAPWLGEHAVYVPSSVDTVRGLILALGGPDTRGFVTGKPLGAPSSEVEASLQALGKELRSLASTHGLAVMGTSMTAIPDDPEWDPEILYNIEHGAATSGHPELATVPILIYGMSTGAPEASGFTARKAARIAGLFLKAPLGVSSATSSDALRVPTYVVQAELDAFADTAALTTAFEQKRSAGALWALARERGVPHHSLSPAQRQLTINWMKTILELRLPAKPADPLREIVESSGWLGNIATGAAAPWGAYAGNRASASWLPSQSTASEWEAFVAASGVTTSAQKSPIP